MDGNLNGRSKIRVLLLSDASVLDLAVKGMLHQDTVMEIVDPEADLADTMHQIQAFVPDVIILNQSRQRRDSAKLWQHLMDDMPGVRLIVLNATETSMSIYEGGTHTIKGATDLLDAVQLTGSELQAAP